MYGGELDDVMAKQEYKGMDDRSSSDSDSSRGNSPAVDLNQASKSMKEEFNPDISQNSYPGGDNSHHSGQGVRPNPITYATDKKRIYPVSGGMTPHQQQMDSENKDMG